jgi:hypothetical protein
MNYALQPGSSRLLALGLLLIAPIPRLFAFTGGRQSSTSKVVMRVDPPALSFADPKTQQSLGSAYNDALKNLLDINTVSYDPIQSDQTGLISDSPDTIVRAGAAYATSWTRDASVNSWNAASLIEPAVARNTLWSVINRQPDGELVIQQDDEWWDQAIWIIAAWNHFLITGDQAFLANAYETARESLRVLKESHYNAAFGLFEGPAFFNDGIAGYPEPPANPTESLGTFVLDYPNADKIMALSTNCIYYEAYRLTGQMATVLGKPATEIMEFTQMAISLKSAINEKFWITRTGLYGYLLEGSHGAENSHDTTAILDPFEEGSGLSFAILFDIADAKMARSILEKAHVQSHGIVDVYPNFPRYSDSRPGRHNQIVWPLVEGFWAEAAAKDRNEEVFAREVSNLAKLDSSSNGHFFEIYNAETGAVDGGWQAGLHMDSEPDQTWSATAYLRMIYNGLFGMCYSTNGIEFRPLLPSGWGDVTMSGFNYRNATFDIRLHGAGTFVHSFRLDGVRQKRDFVGDNLTGPHTIDIAMGSENPLRRFLKKLFRA